jgi:hypothetical protein
MVGPRLTVNRKHDLYVHLITLFITRLRSSLDLVVVRGPFHAVQISVSS